MFGSFLKKHSKRKTNGNVPILRKNMHGLSESDFETLHFFVCLAAYQKQKSLNLVYMLKQ